MTRQLILDVAASMFSSQGYSETSMRQIAAKLGLKSASLYYHFASKELILTEILSISITSVSNAVKKAIGSLPRKSSPSKKLLVAIENHVRALYQKPDYTSTYVRCVGQIPKKTIRAAVPMRDAYEKVWRGLFSEAMAANHIAGGIDALLLRPFLLHSLNRTLAWYDPKRGNVEDLVRIVLKCFSGFFEEKSRNSHDSGVRQ